MFKKINGYDRYYISENGDVLSNDKILKKRINKHGYYYVNLCKDGKYKSICVHRLVGEYFIENKNNFPCINHIDGNKLNNNYINLEWCTQKHNMSEASRMKLLKPKCGNECNLSRGFLNMDIANKIRKERKDTKISYTLLAKKYKCSKSAIIQIIQNKIYKI